MNRYESVIILSANASEEAMAAFGEKMKELISANLNEIIDSLDLVVDGINDVKRAEIFNHLETIILSVSSKGINEVIKDIRTFFLDNKHILSANGQATLRSIINKFMAGRKDNSIQTSCGLKHGL